MLNLRQVITAPKVVTKRKSNVEADLNLKIKDGSAVITISEAIFNEADLQNNRLTVYYEQGDGQIYVICNHSDTIQSNFMKGKLITEKNEDGTDKLDENGEVIKSYGKKTRTFKDNKTLSDQTLLELIKFKFPDLVINEELNLNLQEVPLTEVTGSDEMKAEISKVYTIQLESASNAVEQEEEELTLENN